MIHGLTRALIYILLGGILLTALALMSVRHELILNRQELFQNREIGCIGRYLDHQKYAPQCQAFIDQYREKQ
jgi:hypothetical protein